MDIYEIYKKLLKEAGKDCSDPKCPFCGTILAEPQGDYEDYACPNCDRSYMIDMDNLELKEVFENQWGDIYDDLPEVCKNCGGPYPNCLDSCKIFDQD